MKGQGRREGRSGADFSPDDPGVLLAATPHDIQIALSPHLNLAANDESDAMSARRVHNVARRLACACVLGLAIASPGFAEENAAPKTPDPFDSVTDRNPQLKFDKVDSERIVTRRIDLVGEDGVVRLTLGAPLPNPVVDGVEYRRDRPVNGLMIRDADGNERGGIAFLDGLNMPALIFDHKTSEAAGLVVQNDGSMLFLMVQPGEETRDPRLDNKLTPGAGGPTRLLLSAPAAGEPSMELMDAQSKPRIRLTLTPEGYGSLQFLTADGEIAYALTPEAEKSSRPK